MNALRRQSASGLKTWALLTIKYLDKAGAPKLREARNFLATPWKSKRILVDLLNFLIMNNEFHLKLERFKRIAEMTGNALCLQSVTSRPKRIGSDQFYLPKNKVWWKFLEFGSKDCPQWRVEIDFFPIFHGWIVYLLHKSWKIKAIKGNASILWFKKGVPKCKKVTQRAKLHQIWSYWFPLIYLIVKVKRSQVFP